jgi:hypothetical protein
MRTTTLLLLLAAACGKDSEPPVVAAWKKDGLQTTGLVTIEDKQLGGECRAGLVGGLDVTLCAYANEAAAKAAEEKGLALVGDSTGASLAEGKWLLVVADRRRLDPDGKTLNQITRAFRPPR